MLRTDPADATDGTQLPTDGADTTHPAEYDGKSAQQPRRRWFAIRSGPSDRTTAEQGPTGKSVHRAIGGTRDG